MTPSKFGHRTMVFLACDDGSKICQPCAGELQGPANMYGPVSKAGECCNCGLKVEVLR